MSSLTPRPHQTMALADLMAAFAVHDRVVLTQPPGCGKTLIARWHAQASGAQRVLVLLPSLALVAQTLREWRRLRTWKFDALVVCSDPTTAAGAAERADDADDPGELPDWEGIKVAVTTDVSLTDRFLAHDTETAARIVFATYHSAPVVAAAQSRSRIAFDLVICDEAHRLAGDPSPAFRTVLNSRQILARRRLFMTATPRLCVGEDVISMDDVRIFGPQATSLSVEEAISSGLLCDYQVLVVAGEPAQLDDPLSTAPAAMIKAVDAAGLTKVLSFHNLVAKSAQFAALLHGQVTPGGRTIACRHLDGTMSTAYRSAVLAWLAETGHDEVRIVCNARLLGEGVDVPAVDGIFFADPRSSVVDAVQAVGRVLRVAPGKKLGTVVVPVAVPADADDDTELLLSRYSALWTVLRALRAQDQRLGQEIDALAHDDTELGPDHPRGRCTRRIQYHLPPGLVATIKVRLVQQVGDAWERYFAEVERWAWLNAGRRLPRLTRHNELSIGEWAAKQRTAHGAGILPSERSRRLEQLPGWYWDRSDAAWDDSFAIVAAFAAAQGSVADNPTEPSVFVGLRAALPQRERLGVWIAAQRQARRAGVLDPARVALLEQLPGWSWTPVDVDDLRHVDALRQFCEFEHHADVPTEHLEDGLQLGRWVWDVRRRKLTGHLHPALEDEIWAATPSRWRSGAGRRWNWQKPETQWRLAFTALRRYTDREGIAAPPNKQREQLPDITIRLGQWVALQRHLHRNGELDDQRRAALQRLPGWTWDGDVGGTKAFTEPIDLPAGLDHGSAGAIARGCGCATCVTTRRTKENAWRAERRAEQMTAGVSATQARLHLQHLETRLSAALEDGGNLHRRGAGRGLIAATSGVPLGVIRQVSDGTRTGIDPAHATRLLATTVTMCLSNLTLGSRGRKIQTASQKISAAPTWTLVNDLQQRGFTLRWIGRELGYQNSLQLGGEQVTRRLADQIARLHAQVGDLVATAREVPPLAQLRRRPDKAA